MAKAPRSSSLLRTTSAVTPTRAMTTRTGPLGQPTGESARLSRSRLAQTSTWAPWSSPTTPTTAPSPTPIATTTTRTQTDTSTNRPTTVAVNASLPAGNVGLLCEGSSYVSNFITQPNKLPNTLVGGNFVTEEQSRTAGSTTDREMTAIVPTSSPYRLPERIDLLWNQGLNVTSMDVDYFNNESVSVPGGSSLNLGYDLQTVPVG